MGFGLLLVLFHAGAMHRGEEFRLDLRGIGFYPLVLFGAMFLAVLFSYAPSLSFRFLIYHISAALCVLVTVSAVRSGEDLKRLVAGSSVCVLVSGLCGVYQRIQGVEVNESYVDMKLNAGMPGRVYSFFDNPNTFAQVLILLLPLVLALMLSSRSLLGKAAAAGIFAIGVVALGMTYSRASWIGLVAAALCYVFLWNRRLLPLCFVAGFAAIPLLPTSILNRILTITNMSDSSTSSRFPQYEAAIRLLMREPITGAGLGADAVRRTVQLQSLYQGRAPFVHAHNTFLQIWLETGLLGLGSFIASLIWAAKATARSIKTCQDPVARHMAIGGLSSLFGVMVCGLADYIWTYPRIMFIFWFVFGLTLAAIKVCKMEGNSV